ncbi:short-chain dehydrogenase [Phellopilus nigrolimitatus]|nr:short-chain dehydrogenase [Phellopilus nigrolimitatus]
MAGARRPVVVVTGASKGLGLAVATTLLDSFNAIVVSISRSRSPELLSLLEKHPAALLTIEADVADEPAVREAIGLAHRTYQHLDALVLNAGVIEPFARIGSSDATADKWRAHFDVNFFSLLYTIQAALPLLHKSELGGRIVFVSSGAATGGIASWGAYNASKAAMNSLCRTLANEEPEIVSVALRPGMVDTSMQAAIRSTQPSVMRDEDLKRFSQAHTDSTLVNPDDAGRVIAALSLKASKALSGKFVSWDSEECRL